jgi:hypothetical protein
LGFFNVSVFFFFSISSLGKKRFLKTNKKTKKMGEIIQTAIICSVITLFGLALGFGFINIQKQS